MAVANVGETEQLIKQRREQGLDRFDEMWNGVLHMNPPPIFDHQDIASQLLIALSLTCAPRGMKAVMEAGLFDPIEGEQNYRQPDVMVARPEHITERGVEGGCELVVEVRSPRDETFLKFDFYAANEVKQILVVEPATRIAELYELVDGRYRNVEPDADGALTLACAPITLRTETVDNEPRLVVVTPADEYTI